MNSGYKILGAAILESGFDSMASRYSSDSFYDLSEVCCSTEQGIYNAPVQFMSDFTIKESEDESAMSVITDLKQDWIKTLPDLFRQATGVNTYSERPILLGTYSTFETELCRLSPNSSTIPYYIIERTDAALTIKGSNNQIICSFGPSTFKEGIVPYNFIVELQGGGSGGAGTTYGQWSPWLDGTGGGGGAYTAGIISFAHPDFKFKAIVGAGGAGGKVGTPSNVNTHGAGGGATSISLMRTGKTVTTHLTAAGGIYSEIPAYDGGENEGTRPNAGGIGGSATQKISTASSDTDSRGNRAMYYLSATRGADGGDADNNYNGRSCAACTIACVGISTYQSDSNILKKQQRSGGTGALWGSNNSKDGIDWTGSGGGGASMSASGANARGNAGKYGAGGGGAYYSSYLTGGRGGDGYIAIYY